MSTENAIIRAARELEPQADQAEQEGFQIPSELRKRYDVRIVPGQDGAGQRIGLFLPSDRETPSIEILGNGERIVAHRQDPETVAALVTIAKHNGWEAIEVDGSPEFRQAVWAAGTREGLTVRGYEPTFDELTKMDAVRREDSDQRGREATAKDPVAEQAPVEPGQDDPGRAANAEQKAAGARQRDIADEFSPVDERLLLMLSAYSQDRKALEDNVRDDMSPTEKEFQFERLDANRAALDGALVRVLESEVLVSAFAKAGYEPETLREMARANEWNGEIAGAINLVRSGLSPEAPDQAPALRAAEGARYRVDRWDPAAKEHVALGETNSPSEAVKLFNRETDTRIIDQEVGRAVGYTEWVNDGSFPRWRLEPAMEQRVAREELGREAIPEEMRPLVAEPLRTAEGRELNGEAGPRSSGSEELAALFLHGAADQISAEPRLANALEAQAMMERHLGVVFDGDQRQASSAALESRQMISDVLRRGLDVSVREPIPARQIEPPQITHDLER